MKRIVAMLISALLLVSCGKTGIFDVALRPESPPVTDKPNVSADTVNGVWFSYLDFEEIFINSDKADFEKKMTEVINNCKEIGINAIFLHVRSHGDAYYNSAYYPKTDRIGDIDYDILDTAIRLCHSNGIQVHAWINPLRLQTDFENIDDGFITKKWAQEKNGTYVVNVDGRYYLNPAYEETRNLIINGVKEIVDNYDVDGIHFDDYFYPTTDEAFDSQAFSESKEESLSEFRMANVNSLVKGVYDAIGGRAVFSISPQGNIDNNYNSQYADVRKWCSQSGYVDVIIPQLYYGFRNSTSPFTVTAERWQDMIKCDSVKLMGGLAAYKIGKSDANAGSDGISEWIENDGILAAQIKEIMSQKSAQGIVFYRYNSLFSPSEEVKEKINSEIEAMKPVLTNREN
ncbi:MAG: glycoside hydrolase family 10 protein [Oscillospiraceae bacterium]